MAIYDRIIAALNEAQEIRQQLRGCLLLIEALMQAERAEAQRLLAEFDGMGWTFGDDTPDAKEPGE